MKLVKRTFIIIVVLFFSSTFSYANFIENRGQLKDSKNQKKNDIVAYTQNLPVNIFIHKNGTLSFVMAKNEAKSSKFNDFNFVAPKTEDYKIQVHRFDMVFLGNNIPEISLGDKQESYNHFYNEDEKIEFVYDYNKVVLSSIYKGIDMILYIQNGQIKYDFIVKPTANYEDIKYYFDGKDQLDLLDNGTISIHTSLGEVIDSKPFVYQDKKDEISSSYTLKDGIISYAIGSYDKSKNLIIDPIIWSTYLGGSNYEESYTVEREMIINPNADVNCYFSTNCIYYYNYICGRTQSLNFPITLGSSITSTLDKGFISKYSESDGRKIYALVYESINSNLQFNDIKIVSTNSNVKSNYYFNSQYNKKVIVCGAKFIGTVTNGIINSFDSNTGILNYTVTKLRCYPTKMAKINFGNNHHDKIYITGFISSPTGFFTTSNAHQANFGGGASDAFLMKVKVSDGSTLYASYFGGNSEDLGYGIDVYKSPTSNVEEVFIAGFTKSASGIASLNAFDTTYNPGSGCSYCSTDGFLAKFNFSVNPNASTSDTFSGQQWSTYFGGNGGDQFLNIKVDNEGANSLNNPIRQLHAVGRVVNGGLPIYGNNSVQSSFAGGTDGMLASFSLDTGFCTSSTYLGGNSSDRINAINTYRYYNRYYIELVGGTDSSNFPVTSNAIKNIQSGVSDGFITVLQSNTNNGPDVNSIFFSTYLGSNTDYDEMITDMANIGAGQLTVTGFTTEGFPTQAFMNNPVTFPIAQPTFGGNFDAFITKISYFNAAKTMSDEMIDNPVSKVILYPNPATNQIVIDAVNKEDIIMIYDVFGRVKEKITVTETGIKKIDVTDFSNGFYVCEIINSGIKNQVIKFVIQK